MAGLHRTKVRYADAETALLFFRRGGVVTAGARIARELKGIEEMP